MQRGQQPTGGHQENRLFDLRISDCLPVSKPRSSPRFIIFGESYRGENDEFVISLASALGRGPSSCWLGDDAAGWLRHTLRCPFRRCAASAGPGVARRRMDVWAQKTWAPIGPGSIQCLHHRVPQRAALSRNGWTPKSLWRIATFPLTDCRRRIQPQ